MEMSDSKVIVALDYAKEQDALAFVEQIEPKSCHLKIGKEMFTHFGPKFVRRLQQSGHSIFLDLKFHDIPNTCAHAVAAAADLGVWMVNVHASGGRRMMEASRKILEPYGQDKPLLIGVTVLTSMDQADLFEIGIQCSPKEHVMNLAGLAQQSGLDGVVCSAQEAMALKETLGQDFRLVTPGIRPAGSALGDQRRTMTPFEAVKAGSDYLVIGRPITQSEDPVQMLANINTSLRG